eukprot:5090643-Amphidinium_carterae.1
MGRKVFRERTQFGLKATSPRISIGANMRGMMESALCHAETQGPTCCSCLNQCCLIHGLRASWRDIACVVMRHCQYNGINQHVLYSRSKLPSRITTLAGGGHILCVCHALSCCPPSSSLRMLAFPCCYSPGDTRHWAK